jgi:hypothetical protein
MSSYEGGFMPNYRIIYKLPDGTIAGYHADSVCTITQNPELAKVSKNRSQESAVVWMKTVRRNFSQAWQSGEEFHGFSDEYKNNPIWKGHGPDKISIEVEKFT